MALTLHLLNYTPNNIVENAKLAADAAKGATTIKLDNTQGIAVDDYLLLGKQGSAQGKIHKVASITDDTVTLTVALSFYYERGACVTKLFGNQLKVYAAPYASNSVPADSDYVLLTSAPIDIDPDQLTTTYNHTNGSDQYWYKYTFYNSTALSETSLAASNAARDTTASDYTTIDEVRKEAGFAGNSGVTDDLIYRKLQAAQSKINGMLSGKYVLPLGKPVNAIIADLTVRLAAGYVMIAEYGAFDGQDKSKGEKLRDDAINELKEYQSGSQVITGLDAVSQVVEDGGGFESGFSSDNPLGFSREDIVGYQSRVY